MIHANHFLVPISIIAARRRRGAAPCVEISGIGWGKLPRRPAPLGQSHSPSGHEISYRHDRCDWFDRKGARRPSWQTKSLSTKERHAFTNFLPVHRLYAPSSLPLARPLATTLPELEATRVLWRSVRHLQRARTKSEMPQRNGDYIYKVMAAHKRRQNGKRAQIRPNFDLSRTMLTSNKFLCSKS